MALTKEQESVVLQGRINGDELEAAFPAKLKSGDWEELTRLVFQHIRNSEQLRAPVEMGWCWVEDGVFLHARARAPETERPARAIPMVLIHQGDTWRPDAALEQLARRQFGRFSARKKSGLVSYDDIKSELIDKLREWESFARQFREHIPLTKDGAEFFQKPLKSIASYPKILKFLSDAPPREHPRRSCLAESLILRCSDLRKLLEKPRFEPSDLIDAVDTALEAGKLFAWLDVVKDPKTMQEHRKSARFSSGPSGAESREIEEAVDYLLKAEGRPPTPREVLAYKRYETREGEQGMEVWMPAEGDAGEWISWKAFEKRVQNIRRRLCPGQSSRGRPRKVTT